MDRVKRWSALVATWIVLVSLWIADGLIWFMLMTRSNERRIRPTERVNWPKGLKQQLMRQQDNTCGYCGKRRTAKTLDIDHMIPAVRGGSNDISNLQVICRPCNQRKGLQTDEEFRLRYARLVPQARLTPPSRPISQSEFREETRRTSQVESVREFPPDAIHYEAEQGDFRELLSWSRCLPHHSLCPRFRWCRGQFTLVPVANPRSRCGHRGMGQSLHDRRDD